MPVRPAPEEIMYPVHGGYILSLKYLIHVFLLINLMTNFPNT